MALITGPVRKTLRKTLSTLSKGFALTARDCVLCGATARGAAQQMLCDACDASLSLRPPEVCPQCGISSPKAMLCGDCLADPPAFDATLAVFTYRFPFDQLIQSFKYSANLALTDFFAARLVETLHASQSTLADVVIPLPLARKRLSERGFNQAILIAQSVAQKLNLPLETTALVRVRETLPQTGLPWKQRHANVKGAFTCNTDLGGRHVALLDDVMTTGATLNEAAKQLKKNGAARVTAWVMARAEKEIPALGWESEVDSRHV